MANPATLPVGGGGGTTQKVAYTGTAAATTNAVGNSTNVVRLVATTDCYLAFGAGPTATTGSMYFPANTVEYFSVNPGNTKISALRVNTSGTLDVTEVG